MDPKTRNAWYKIAQPNGTPVYGYGTEQQATQLAERISAHLDVDHYRAEEIDDADLVARLEAGSEGVDLTEEMLSAKGRSGGCR